MTDKASPLVRLCSKKNAVICIGGCSSLHSRGRTLVLHCRIVKQEFLASSSALPESLQLAEHVETTSHFQIDAERATSPEIVCEDFLCQ